VYAAAADPPKYTLLTYEYVPDILEKRGPYREGHLAAAFKKVRCFLPPSPKPGVTSLVGWDLILLAQCLYRQD